MRAWSLLSFGDERDFQGNDGYPDVPEAFYIYDSTVHNSSEVTEGDLIVVRGKKVALGAATIEKIDVEPNLTKPRNTCPNCGLTNFKQRTMLTPRYLCLRESCRTTFDEPVPKDIDITRYTARYERTWRALDGAITVDLLRTAALNNSKQQSISPLNVSTLESMLAKMLVTLPKPSATPPPPIVGGHRRALVKVRNGQKAYREQLLQKYGLICAVTGPCPAEALEAAHLLAFSAHGLHDVDEGLLLRSDIHKLFDRGLVAVHPTTLQVYVSSTIRDYPAYSGLHGTRLQVPPPNRGALRKHFREAHSASL